MGGIAGVRAFSGGVVAADALRDMAELLRHRGPDESGVWVGQDIGLTHTRLAVIDVEHSHQPMHSVDGRWVLAFNGEILNHLHLRNSLDYPFRTHGDTEVVVAGLALEGIAFVERLQGQFALVAHDLRTDTTHLVRDRLGILPLCYRHIPGGIAFGSEVKALLTVGAAPRVDLRSLHSYVDSRAVPAPNTLFEGVKKVRPAHRVSIMPGAHLEETRYWAPPECDPEGTWTAGDVIEAVGDGVREAVRAALVADVPVGTHLSGGLGSGVLAAQMQQLRGTDSVLTFSAGFADHTQHDLRRSRRISGLLGTEHHEVQVGAGDFEDLWAHLTWHRDAPVSEPEDVAAYAVARAAREHVRVLLSDVGGDELFGSHPKHHPARVVERRVRSALRSMAGGHVVEQPTWGTPFTASERDRLLGSVPPPDQRTSSSRGADPADRLLREEIRHRLPDDLLERADRMGMAASLEVRPPLLDHRLVELACRLPSSVKVRSGSSAWILQEIARPLLPYDVIEHRQVSRGVPLDTWFRAGLRDTARDRLVGADSWVGQSFNRSMVRDLLDRHHRGANEQIQLWTLLGLEMWHDCFFGASPVVPRPRQWATTSLPMARGRAG